MKNDGRSEGEGCERGIVADPGAAQELTAVTRGCLTAASLRTLFSFQALACCSGSCSPSINACLPATLRICRRLSFRRGMPQSDVGKGIRQRINRDTHT